MQQRQDLLKTPVRLFRTLCSILPLFFSSLLLYLILVFHFLKARFFILSRMGPIQKDFQIGQVIFLFTQSIRNWWNCIDEDCEIVKLHRF